MLTDGAGAATTEKMTPAGQTANRSSSPGARAEAITAPEPGLRTTVLPHVKWEGEVPQLIPLERQRFEEVRPLGAGGMGEVVLAQDHDIDRSVAVKRLPTEADPGLVLRFIEEIRTVGQLEHPNIVPLHDVGIDSAGRYYFVMKHLRGDTLESIIERLRAGDPATHARFPNEVRTQLFLGVLNAVAYAHQRGFVHRDLKPANIMVGPFGEVTVMDWGLAKRLDRPGAVPGPGAQDAAPPATGPARLLQTQLGAVIGTPLYMSPEQAAGANDTLDERSDLYSLAVVFHELIFLTHYLEGRQGLEQVLEGVRTVVPEPLPLTTHPHARPPAELGWYLQRGLRKDPGERYQSAGEMGDELQRIVRGEMRVQCQRTLAKRVLHEAIHVVDRYPKLTIIGSTLAASLVLGALVKAALGLLG